MLRWSGVAPDDRPKKGGFTADGPTVDSKRPADVEGRLNLAILGEGFVATHPLPPRGALTIGRGTDADLRVDHESVSRKHVRLHVGDGLFVEDLGSSNGTKVGDQTLGAGEKV